MEPMDPRYDAYKARPYTKFLQRQREATTREKREIRSTRLLWLSDIVGFLVGLAVFTIPHAVMWAFFAETLSRISLSIRLISFVSGLSRINLEGNITGFFLPLAVSTVLLTWLKLRYSASLAQLILRTALFFVLVTAGIWLSGFDSPETYHFMHM